jgi:hypothetical protein
MWNIETPHAPYHNVFKERTHYQWDEHRSYFRLTPVLVTLSIPARGISSNAVFHPTIKIPQGYFLWAPWAFSRRFL